MLLQLLAQIRDWNTSTRTSRVAQTLLRFVMASVPPIRLARIPGMKALIESLLPYSTRHRDRLDKLLRGPPPAAKYSSISLVKRSEF